MLNRVVLVGRITKELELQHTSSNIPFVRFTLACNRSFRSQNGGQEADFIGCIAWRNQAENLTKFMSKGSLIGLDGRIQTGSYDKDGQRVFTTDIVADSITFLEFKNSQGQQGNFNQAPTPPANNFNNAPNNNYNNQASYQNQGMNNNNNNNYNNQNNYSNNNQNNNNNNQNQGGFPNNNISEDDLPF